MENAGCLMICAPAAEADGQRCECEAVLAYQRARAAFGHLTLLGAGMGSAYCLMLAQRFSPDELVLAPLTCGGDAQRFACEVKKRARGLYAVCAPVRVLLPASVNAADERRIHRLLSMTKSAARQVDMLDSAADTYRALENMANRVRTIKTLA